MAGFLGMRGTGNWATDQRPKNWREMILYLYPNGSAPLTAVLSKLSEESTTDPEFNWWTKTLPTQKATLTDFAPQSDGETGTVAAGVAAGTVVYGKCSEADADQFRTGHQVLLRDASDTALDTVAKVVSVVKDGASSILGFKLLEENNGLTDPGTAASACDTALIIGNINAEGASSPDAIGYDPVKYTNYTQIFRTPLQISRTARATKLRTGDAYKELKREALELHSIEMEKAFIHGVKSETTGNTGLPERSTDGLLNFIATNASGNILDYQNDTHLGNLGVTTNTAWTVNGEHFLDAALEQIFRYGSNEKLVFCGSGALLGIQRLAKAGGQIQLSPKSEAYGMKVVEWITPFGVIYLKTHPLFSYEASTRNWMVVMEPEKLKYRFIDDTKFSDVTPVGQDGTKEEFLTECGLELHHPEAFGIFKGVGLDNAS